jgi:RF-1 domain
MHPAAMAIDELLQHCELRKTRRSGPGGQRRNKVETAVIIEHRPSGISAEASERRSAAENRQVALFRLRVKLALQVREVPIEGSLPSALWQSRCRQGIVAVNSGHDDFPALLAEALDVVTMLEFDLAQSALRLKCTSSQLVKFLKQEPRALVLVNAARAQKGLREMK